MKQKFINGTSEELYFKIIMIVSKSKDPMKVAKKLRKKLGFNKKQIDFIFDVNYEEEIKDTNDLKTKLISMENKKIDYQSTKLKSDSKFIFVSMLDRLGCFVLFFLITVLVLYLAIYDTYGRTEFNINGLRYFVVPFLFTISIVFLFSSFKFIRLHLGLKKDIANNEVSTAIIHDLKCIKTIREYKGRNNVKIVGVILYSREGNKVKKYYLFLRDKLLYRVNRQKIKKLCNKRYEIKFLNNSGYVISCSNTVEIIKAFNVD